MIRAKAWQVWAWSAVLALTLALMIKADVAHLEWAATLSTQGSPAPPQDSDSPAGYALGQRHLLGTYQRGETYRWIAATQEFIASGPFASHTYESDTVPEGRPQLLPKLYTAWLAGVSWGLHLFTGEPIALAVERAALWEPVVSHALAFVAAVAFMWMRYGPTGAGLTGLFLALFPPLVGQFLPGVVTAGTWALLLASYAIALALPFHRAPRKTLAFSTRSAVAASFALWLDPTYGFASVLIVAMAGAAAMPGRQTQLSCVAWSLVGSGITLAAWLLDQAPWTPDAGELRYVHPLYALAWLGIGLGLDGWQNLRRMNQRRKRCVAEVVVAVPLIGALVYSQVSEGYSGWLYTSASMRRLTSLDEASVFNTAFDWLARVSFAEVALVSVPVLFAIVLLAFRFRPERAADSERWPSLALATIVLVGVVGLACFKLRWAVIASLVALPLVGGLASSTSLAVRGTLLSVAAAYLLALFAWGRELPASLQRPSGEDPLRPEDLHALVYRHFSHWLASHNPGQPVSALAPPELSDSIVFHGGCRVLMSTAWESYPGHVAASRVLSAPEDTEVEAVLESRQITHVILPSWDRVFPLLEREPDLEGRDTHYARLQRWVHPRFMQAIPYQMPPAPGLAGEKLPVFKVVPPQDEVLSLSRLAEYFVEMDRPDPAGSAASVLADAFPDDPNAAIARATVYAHVDDAAGFNRELERLAADVIAGRTPLLWDRRVQRAIVLALGRRYEPARAEIEACVAAASEETLFDLTPLQAFRLRVLAEDFGATFSDDHLAALLVSLGAEYSEGPAGAQHP